MGRRDTKKIGNSSRYINTFIMNGGKEESFLITPEIILPGVSKRYDVAKTIHISHKCITTRSPRPSWSVFKRF